MPISDYVRIQLKSCLYLAVLNLGLGGSSYSGSLYHPLGSLYQAQVGFSRFFLSVLLVTPANIPDRRQQLCHYGWGRRGRDTRVLGGLRQLSACNRRRRSNMLRSQACLSRRLCLFSLALSGFQLSRKCTDGCSCRSTGGRNLVSNLKDRLSFRLQW
jgi:hypothetical protein